jgi:hypothetical protein
MIDKLRRLFSRVQPSMDVMVGNGVLASCDRAQGSWDPVPATAMGKDWGQWLAQDDPTASVRRKKKPKKESPPVDLQLLSGEAEEDKPGDVDVTNSALKDKQRGANSSSTGREWHKVLSSYGEHLTDEELAIIRKQMAR